MKTKQQKRMETRHYSKADLLRRWLKRGERRPKEGALAGALLELPAPHESALRAIRESRERLDSLHGRVLDLAPRLRDLCSALAALERRAGARAGARRDRRLAIDRPRSRERPGPLQER